MKKLLTIFMVLAMILAMSTTAIAAETTAFAAENTSITINGEEGRTYNGYQLLSLTTSLKGDAQHPENCDKVNHSDDCYNYAYTVNTKYHNVLQYEVFANGGNYLWEGGVKPTEVTGVTDDQILKYLSNQTSDNGDVYMTMRQVADRLYRAIKEAGIAADATGLDGKDNTVEQGYWMFADVTALTGNESNSLVMVDTAGQESVSINPKTALPTVEKKVKDIEDSEDDNILDNPWQDTADHDIGDTVPFKLTATLPSNAQNYQSYKLVFHDTLSAGLTLDADSVKVLMYETKHKADVDTDLNDNIKTDETLTAIDVNFEVKTTGMEDDCSFEVVCDNIFKIPGGTKDTAFVVYYEATLNDKAVIGAVGNPNEVYLEFSNNPYDEGTGKTEIDEVTVFTYELVVNKTDSHGHELEGAGFTLYKKDINGDYVALGGELKGDAMTTFTWTGLDDGDYKLEESTVPNGYNKISDIIFSISAEHSEVAGELVLTHLDGGLMGEGVVDTGIIEKDIVNNTGTVLPETGARGTFILICGGALLMIIAAVFMITRKKMSVFED